MLDKYLYTFNRFLQERFNERVHKLSLNAGAGCPNKDGTLNSEGCIFCNEQAFTFFKDRGISLNEQITTAIAAARQRFNARKFIAYFQEGSTTRIPNARLEEIFDTIRAFKEIVGLFVSTRPDCINEKTAMLADRYCQDYLVCIELGMQTASDTSLRFLNRNHTNADIARAAACLKKNSKALIAAHLILGIPGESYKEYDATIANVNSLGISGVKFHLFHILKDTKAEALFRKNDIRVLDEKEYLDSLIYCIERLRRDIFIERLISTAAPDCLVSPAWMNDRSRFLLLLEQEMKKRGAFQGKERRIG